MRHTATSAAPQLAGALARAAERGGAIFARARVLEVSRDGYALRVTTTDGDRDAATS